MPVFSSSVVRVGSGVGTAGGCALDILRDGAGKNPAWGTNSTRVSSARTGLVAVRRGSMCQLGKVAAWMRGSRTDAKARSHTSESAAARARRMARVTRPASARSSTLPAAIHSMPDARRLSVAANSGREGNAMSVSVSAGLRGIRGFVDQVGKTTQFLWCELSRTTRVAEVGCDGVAEGAAEEDVEDAAEGGAPRLAAVLGRSVDELAAEIGRAPCRDGTA